MNYGEEEGETCNRDGCEGTMELEQESCFCSATSNPPCSNCEHSRIVCDNCCWDAEEEFEEIPKKIYIPEDITFTLNGHLYLRPPIVLPDGIEVISDVDFTKGFTQNKTQEENNMTRKVNTYILIDNDSNLPAEMSLVATFKDVVTDDTDEMTVNQLLVDNDIKELIAKHNKRRNEVVNPKILDNTGREVYLKDIKMKDLNWQVK